MARRARWNDSFHPGERLRGMDTDPYPARGSAQPLRARSLAVVVAVALMAAACSSSDSDSSSNRGGASEARGIAETVEVGGRSIYLQCKGTGSPTVVLQAGYGNAGDIWSVTDTTSPAVFPALAKTNRVCTYDRPGSKITTTRAGGAVTLGETARRSRSDSAPMPRDPADVVTELHDLLAAADVPGPYVLVGHSLGGAFDLLYARTYPDEVSALVTVDSPLPAQRDLIPPDLRDKAKLGPLDPSLVPGYELEAYDLDTLFDEIDAAGALPDIPVVVVRRGAPKMSDDPIPEGGPITAAEIDAISAAQWNGQAAWAAGVSGAKVITVPDTTHYVQNQRPDAVVAAIREAMARLTCFHPRSDDLPTDVSGLQPLDAGLAPSGGGGRRRRSVNCGRRPGRPRRRAGDVAGCTARGPLGSTDRRPADGRSRHRQDTTRRRSRGLGTGGWDARPARRGRRVTARPDGAVAWRLPRTRRRARQRSVAAGRGATMGTSRVAVRRVALARTDLGGARGPALGRPDRDLGARPPAAGPRRRTHRAGRDQSGSRARDAPSRWGATRRPCGAAERARRRRRSPARGRGDDGIGGRGRAPHAHGRQSAVRAGTRTLPRRGRGDR